MLRDHRRAVFHLAKNDDARDAGKSLGRSPKPNKQLNRRAQRKQVTTGYKKNAHAVVTVKHPDGTVTHEMPKAYYDIRRADKRRRERLSAQEQHRRSLINAHNKNNRATKQIINNGQEWLDSLPPNQQQTYWNNRKAAHNNLRQSL